MDPEANPFAGWDRRDRAVQAPEDRAAMGRRAGALAGRRIPEDPSRLGCG